jgi:hypothetical protein
MKKKWNPQRLVQAAISLLALVLLIVHWRSPSFDVDVTTVVLFIILVLPWTSALIKSVEFPGGWKVEFQDSKELQAAAKAKVAKEIKRTKGSAKKIKWSKVATIFWLGNDLMWVKDMTYRFAPPERVLLGVNHCLEYAKELGFDSKSLPVQELVLAQQVLQSLSGVSPATEEMRRFLEGHYIGVRQHVQTVKWYIDALATQEQPGFQKKRAL